MHKQTRTHCAKDPESLYALVKESFPEFLIDSLPCAFFVVSQELRLILWNRYFQILTEFSDEELATISLLETVEDDYRREVEEAARRAFDGKLIQMDSVCRSKSGRKVPMFVTCRRVLIAGQNCLVVTGWDATQHRLAEQRLAEERNLLSTVIDNLPDAVYVKDREGRFAMCNREVLRRNQLESVEEIEGRPEAHFHPPEVARGIHADEQELMKTGQSLINEERCVPDKTTGRLTWSLTTKVPLRNAAKEIVGLVGIVRDITDRKRVEEAYHTIVDCSLQGLLVIQNMRIVFANQAMAKISGYTLDEMLSGSVERLREFVHPLDREWVWANHEARLRGESLPEQYEFRAIRKDGTVRWIEIMTSRIDYQGQPAIYAACVDVTDRHRAQEALQRSEARNQALLNANPDLMFRLTRGGVFLDCKPPKEDAVSVSPAQFVGKHLDEVFSASTARTWMQLIHRAIDTGQVQTFEYSLPRTEGESADFECRLVACAEQEVVAIVRDISDRRRGERLAKLQRDMAIRLSSLSTLAEGLRHCLDAAIQSSHMDSGGIYVLDEHAGCLKLEVHVGLSEDFIAETASYPLNSRNTRLILEGAPYYAQYDQIEVPIGPGQKAEGLHAIAIIPIRNEDRVIGCLNVASHTTRNVPPGARVVLETIAAQIGSAISRLKVQEALSRAEREKAIILNTMPQIVTYHDVSHRILWANRIALEALKKTAEEIVGRRCYELWADTTMPCGGCPVDLALRTGCSQESEIIGYNGGTWLVRGEPVRDQAGRLQGVVELAIDITQRKRAEEGLRRRLQFEGLITSISTDFANLSSDRVEEGVERTLAGIGRFVRADRCYVFLLHDDGAKMSKVREWCAEGIDRVQGRVWDLETKSFPLGLEQLRREGILHVPSVRQLQGPLAEAKGILESIGVQSLLAVPIQVGSELFGILGVSAVREERVWPEDAGSLLKIAAEIMANALERKRAGDLLRERLAFETLLSELSASIISLHSEEIDGQITQWLARIGEQLRIDRSKIVQFFGSEMRVTHSWVAPGLDPAPFDLRKEDFGWFLGRLRQGETVAFARIEEAPEEAAREKEYCRRYGIKSIIVMPLEVAGSPLGLLSFSCVKAHREWSEELVQRLHLVAQIFANAILRARAEEALRASETRFRSLVRAVPTGIGLISERVLLEVNDRICEMTGYSRGELINRNVRLLYPTQKHYDEVDAVAYRQIREHGSGTIETCWRCKDGRIINVVLSGTPLDPNDLSKGYTFAVLDVTERKKAELALQESERRLRTLMANLPGVAYRCANAPGWPFQFVSDGSVALTGYTPQELTNGEILFGNLIHPDDQQKVWDIVQDAVPRDMSFDLEYRIRVKDGTEKWVFERGRAVSSLQGESSFLEGFIMDITDRKKAMMEAQRHLAELTRAWHANMLGQMATELAHELNQPLCAIVNYSNGCLRLTRRRGYSLETLQDSIERIAVQAQRAADILKRIRGLIAKHDPLRATVDLTGILNDAVQMVKDEAVKNNVAIVCRLQPGLPKVKADRVEIEQVVLNLMRNAIDAMSDPQIAQRKLTITSRLVESHKIEISVKDTGRGIPPDLWEKIFEPFFSTKSQGLGVGLSLSQRIVEAHGGRLWGESDGRSGSTFRFTLPVKGAVHGDE